MVAADHDRRGDVAAADHLVEAQPEPVALAVAEPADPRRQALERDPLAGQADPAGQPLVVGELLEHGPVGGGDVGRIARQRDPAERALALAEQRADVGGQEAGVGERAVEAAELGLGAQAVAVVEHLGAARRGTRPSPRSASAIDSRARRTSTSGSVRASSAAASGVRSTGTYDSGSWALVWSVTMSAGKPASSSRGSTSAALPTTPTDSARALVAGAACSGDGVVEVVGDLVEVAGLDASLDAGGSTSMHRATPSFIVIASGWAPPMPPSPAVSVIVPASEPPKRRRAISAKHS